MQYFEQFCTGNEKQENTEKTRHPSHESMTFLDLSKKWFVLNIVLLVLDYRDQLQLIPECQWGFVPEKTYCKLGIV